MLKASIVIDLVVIRAVGKTTIRTANSIIQYLISIHSIFYQTANNNYSFTH
jgi:predicted AAA+ superfamily ATPase